MKLGLYEDAEKDFLAAVKMFEVKDETGQGKYRLQYNLGITYRKLGKYTESVEHLTKSIDHINNADRSAAYNYRGLSNFENGSFSDA